MIKKSTSIQNDVIRYVFKETNYQENETIENSIATDQDALSLYIDLLDIRRLMDKINLYPSDESIEKILNFSRNRQPAI